MMDFLNDFYLPIRLLASFLLGFWWSVSGSLLQWGTQNPLACPVTLGLTAIPVAGWLLAIILNLPLNGGSNVMAALIIILVIHVVLWKLVTKQNLKLKKSFFDNRIVLMGMSLNLSLAALFALVHFSYSAQGKNIPAQMWFGMLKTMDSERFVILLLGSSIFAFALKFLLMDLSRLSLGIGMAKNICSVEVIERRLIFFVSLLMALLVFVGGLFSFWGLVIPHLLRKISFLRRSLFHEVWVGGVVAGLIMLILDRLCYEYPVAGAELPVGLITSVLGPIMLLTTLKNR